VGWWHLKGKCGCTHWSSLSPTRRRVFSSVDSSIASKPNGVTVWLFAIYLWLEDNMIQGVESTHHELDPLIQREGTKKEARMARAQFLALCWALIVIGWTDGSTGPLLPRIQTFYDVSWHFPLIIFQLLINSADRVQICVLGICVAMHGWWSLLGRGDDYLTPFSGSSCGSIAQYAIER
jgi:hypothetical protein